MKYVNTADMRQTGRNLDVNTPNLPDIFLTYNCDFGSEETYSFSFVDSNQLKQYGIVETIFIDNSSNDNEIEVSVTVTDQFFTVPAFAQGYFPISAAANSVVQLYSLGGATDIVTVNFYNYKISAVVWYRYGPTNTNIPLKTYGPMVPGDTIALENFNTPVYVGGIDNTGVFRGLLTDTTGAIQIAGVVSLSGSIIIDDGDDAALGATTNAAVTNPASNATLIAINKGQLSLLTDIETGVDGLEALITSSNALLTDIDNNTDGIEALLTTIDADTGNMVGLLATIDADTGTILTNTNDLIKKATAAANSSVAGSASSVTILASNTNRRGATVFNDSTAILYLNLDDSAASTTNYTVQLAASAYYEIPFGYTGEIRGIWASATGNARVTEFT